MRKYEIPIPDNCVAWQVHEVGSGGACVGSGAGQATEPTPEMIEAGAEVIDRLFYNVVPTGSLTVRSVVEQIYKAMCEARSP